jgi:hypothetical protein
MNNKNLFRSGNDKKDLLSLVDCAYDIVELWKLEEFQVYNKMLKEAWLIRAKELGTVPSL